jgi:hypothetical protein
MAEKAAQSRSFVKRFLIRDGLILALTACLFIWPSDVFALQLAKGGLVGLCAYLFHEWAHLIGALVGNAKLSVASSLYSPFLFSFASLENSLAQFFAMTLPGFIATAMYLFVFIKFLPSQSLWGETALAIGWLLAALTIIIEGPIALYALVFRRVPAVEIPFLGDNPLLSRIFKRWRED